MAEVEFTPMHGTCMATGRPSRLQMWQMRYIDDIESRYAGICRKVGNLEIRDGFTDEEKAVIKQKAEEFLQRPVESVEPKKSYVKPSDDDTTEGDQEE